MSGDALAQLDNYRGSEPTMVTAPFDPSFNAGTFGNAFLYPLALPSLWRPRCVSVQGAASGTMGALVLSLSFFIEQDATGQWTVPGVGGLITATSPQSVPFGSPFSHCWSTEVGDSYTGFNFEWGATAMLGLPLVFLPGHTDVVLEWTGTGGYDGDLNITAGFIQVEKFPVATTQAGGQDQLANVYLLPQTI